MDIFLISLILLMLLVIYFDLTSYTIPNWLNGLVLALFPVLYFIHPTEMDWHSALLAFGVVFAVGFIIFSLNIMGGGDIKLLIALAPYYGFSMKLMDFILIVALLGGALSVILWVGRKALGQFIARQTEQSLPRIFQTGAPVPYGLAIAGAFLHSLWIGDIAGIVLKVF
jgi:prepilin peptidase CpaA